MATHFPTLRQLPSPLLPNKKPALSILRRDLCLAVLRLTRKMIDACAVERSTLPHIGSLTLKTPSCAPCS